MKAASADNPQTRARILGIIVSAEAQLEAIARSVRRCKRCRLWRSRTHAVPGEGDARAKIVFIGEAPGRVEDEIGRPFQGMAGREFDALLHLAGLKRQDIFVTSVNKCRPPDNRRPRRDEMHICRRVHLDRQLAVIAPRLVVLMGAVAAEEMLGRTGLQRAAGRTIERDGRHYLVTYHPAASMRFPNVRQAARRHFSRLRRIAARPPAPIPRAEVEPRAWHAAGNRCRSTPPARP